MTSYVVALSFSGFLEPFPWMGKERMKMVCGDFYRPGLEKNITLFMSSPTGKLGAQEKVKCVLGITKQPMRG